MNQLLYGSNQEENIVAVHPASDRSMRMYIRNAGGITTRDAEFYPFFFISNPKFLVDYKKKHWVKELGGENYYKYLCVFISWLDLWDAIRYVLEKYNENAPVKVDSFSDLPVLHLRTDPVTQFLTQSGRTLFKGSIFGNLRRLQLNIAAYTKPGFKINNPQRAEDRILVIALSDNGGWNHTIGGKRITEKTMLLDLIKVIHDKDPDVIEGHNIFGFDLPYILARCEMNGIDFAVGRDGSSPHPFDTRLAYAERSKDYSSYEIAGRHIIDTFLLLQSYDSSKHQLSNYTLKYASQYFDFSQKDRVYIPEEKINWYWDNEPETLEHAYLNNASDIQKLSLRLSPALFYQTQMLPFNYGTVARLGPTAKIDSLILRHYLAQKHSIPKPEAGSQGVSDYTEIFYRGILGPAIDVVIESVHASLMLNENPKPDALRACPALMQALADLSAGNKGELEDPDRLLQNEMKSAAVILLNSFYPYIGSNRALFNDYKEADRIAGAGNKILQDLIESIIEFGGTPICADSDRIYLVPPIPVQDKKAQNKFIGKIGKRHPSPITLRINGSYKRMFSFKKTNYALLDFDDKVTIRGSSLVSKNMEKFGRQFVLDCVAGLLRSDYVSVHEHYVKLYKAIIGHKLTVREFSRTELLREGFEEYTEAVRSGSRNRTVNYEAAVRARINWKAGERVSYYFTGDETNVKGIENCKLAEEWDPNFPDENSAYYLKRLDDFAKRFEDFFTPSDFHLIFTPDDLFGFSPNGIQVVTIPVSPETRDIPEEETDTMQADPKIWLDES